MVSDNTVATNARYPTVTVMSCAESKGWIPDSERLGIKMSNLLGRSGDYVVDVPKTALGFFTGWNRAGEFVWIHTRGNSDAFYDMIEGGESPMIISKDELAKIAVNDRIRFVMISSAFSTSLSLKDNVAYQLSKKIDPTGIVIGCADNTLGNASFYRGVKQGESWRIYRNGEVIATIPQVTLTPENLIEIYRALCPNDDLASPVTVFSCEQKDWIADSVRMGKNMSALFGRRDEYVVKAPKNMLDFFNTWNRAGKCVIVHTHGSAEGIYNQIESGDHPPTPTMIDKKHISELSRNNNILFAYLSACSVAAGKEDDNVAYWISKKINPKGIVIANTDVVSGNASSYRGKKAKQTWKVYRDGKVLATIPQVDLTPAEAYDVYKSFFD